jgi:glyoxylate/hydroxypyruvate reductase A
MRITFCCADTDAPAWLDALRAAFPQADVRVWQDGDAPADYAVVWAPPQMFFDQQTGLKAVFNIGAGVDALLEKRISPHTRIVRLDDAGMAVQMAEYVCHALIRHTRELDIHSAHMQAGQWTFREPLPRASFPVGILGMGVLGSRVAKAVAHFEFPVHGWSRSPKSMEGIRCFSGTNELPEFLASTRVLVNLLPLTPETENILNRTTLSQLQPGAYLINVARGRHLVEDDLLHLLASGHLAGATLDVFRTEPLPAAHPFWNHPKITLTPHTAAQTLRDVTIGQIARKLAALEQSQAIEGIVDVHKGY